MQGNNPIRPPVISEGAVLDIQHIFPTLQGEGPYAGHPAVFVRLGGCNLACDFCDTEFEDFAGMTIEAIVETIIRQAQNNQQQRVRPLVVITGGEPLRQNIAPLCTALLKEGFKLQIETNGTLYRPLPPHVNIVCSPKNNGNGYFPIREDLLPQITALKFIISKHREAYRSVAEVGQTAYAIPVYIQPMDEGDAARNAENTAYALELAMRQGYRLSLQLHKLLEIE